MRCRVLQSQWPCGSHRPAGGLTGFFGGILVYMDRLRYKPLLGRVVAPEEAAALRRALSLACPSLEVLSAWDEEPADAVPRPDRGAEHARVLWDADIVAVPVALRALLDGVPTAEWIAGDRSWTLGVPFPAGPGRRAVAVATRRGYGRRFPVSAARRGSSRGPSGGGPWAGRRSSAGRPGWYPCGRRDLVLHPPSTSPPPRGPDPGVGRCPAEPAPHPGARRPASPAATPPASPAPCSPRRARRSRSRPGRRRTSD